MEFGLQSAVGMSQKDGAQSKRPTTHAEEKLTIRKKTIGGAY